MYTLNIGDHCTPIMPYPRLPSKRSFLKGDTQNTRRIECLKNEEGIYFSGSAARRLASRI